MANIFAHRGIIGVSAVVEDDSAPDGVRISDAVVNEWDKPGQLGIVCEAEKCEFSQEAIDLLKTIKKSGDSIGEVDIFGDPKKIIFNWLGGPMRIIDPTSDGTDGSRDYDPSLLDHVKVVPNNPPAQFIEAVDTYLLEKEANGE